MRALGVGSETRIPELPEVPAIAELYPGYLNVAWYAFVAPPKTPDAIVRKLSDAIAETLQRPEVARRMRELGLDAARALARRNGGLHQERGRALGQGDPRRRDQGGVSRPPHAGIGTSPTSLGTL